MKITSRPIDDLGLQYAGTKYFTPRHNVMTLMDSAPFNETLFEFTSRGTRAVGPSQTGFMFRRMSPLQYNMRTEKINIFV